MRRFYSRTMKKATVSSDQSHIVCYKEQRQTVAYHQKPIGIEACFLLSLWLYFSRLYVVPEGNGVRSANVSKN